MFITLEGPEGSGKTTQLPLLADYLRQQGYSVLTTREPGGTVIGTQIRTVLMNLENTQMHPRAETLLFLAARAQLVEEVIRPHLAQGGLVISDRYADSTLAYQGYGHQADLSVIRSLLQFATGGLVPDLTLLLAVDPAAGLGRKTASNEWNRMDAYSQEFHTRVSRGYAALAQAEPQRWVTIDASQPAGTVQACLRAAVMDRLSQKGSHA